MNRKRNCLVLGNKVVLVPYRPDHVEKYHGWMQSAELRAQTASEPLTLEEEYEMQKKWMNDNDKSTFIILNKKLYEDALVSEISSMIGDVNLFFNEPDNARLAEVEVMIAEPSARRQGFAYEALLLMMCYGKELPLIQITLFDCTAAIGELGVTKFRAKISETNAASLQLFNKLDFVEVGRNAVFKEVILECTVMKMLIKEKMTTIGLNGDQLDWKTYIPKPTASSVHS